MPKLNQTRASSTQRIMLFGPPKTGKTLLAGKLARHFNILYIGMENGHEVLFQLPEEDQEKIEVLNLPDNSKFPVASETVLKLIKGKCKVCWFHGKVNCMICAREKPEDFTEIDVNSLDNSWVVIYDSATQLFTSILAHITKGEDDEYKLQRDDWNKASRLSEIFYSHIQTSKYNCVVISHDLDLANDEDQKAGKKSTIVPTGGTKNFSKNVSRYFDHVVYCERKNLRHVFSSSTIWSNIVATGSRHSIALEKLDPNAEATLLPFFKPEEFPELIVPNHAGNAGAVGEPTASSILNKLKK